MGSGLSADLGHSRPADVLINDWELGKPAALVFTVTSPLTSSIMSEAGTTEGAAALARKHTANDPKWEELGWVCVPMAVETNGNWDKEARSTFNKLASCLSIVSSLHKSRVIFVWNVELVPGSVEL